MCVKAVCSYMFYLILVRMDQQNNKNYWVSSKTSNTHTSLTSKRH